MLLFYLNVNQYPIRVCFFFLSQKSWERFMCKTILAAESVMVILLSWTVFIATVEAFNRWFSFVFFVYKQNTSKTR